MESEAPLIVVTGGPGAGKTALLEVIQRHADVRVQVLPEAAGIVFGGGFPRKASLEGRRSAQRTIFFVQRELERLAIEEAKARIVLCDRGTLDGTAYWPGDPETLLQEMGTSRKLELARYELVIHLRTPPVGQYNHRNPLRLETVEEAEAIDERILAAWEGHPRRVFIEHSDDFLEKISKAIAVVRAEVLRVFPDGGDTFVSSSTT